MSKLDVAESPSTPQVKPEGAGDLRNESVKQDTL